MIRPLPFLRTHVHPSRAGWALGLLWAAAAVAAEPGITVHGALLPQDAQKVGENRYRTSEDWGGVERFYKGNYPQKEYPRKQIVNQPGIKALHITNPGGKNFEGLNIYQAGDEVRIYIVPAEKRKKPEKPSEPKTK